MFRYTKPVLNSLNKFAQRSGAPLISMKTSLRGASDAATKDDTSGRVKGAPPVSVSDLYGLLFMSEPRVYALEREPKDMFENDTKLNEVFCYINGGYGAPRDDRTTNALWEMLDIKCLIAYRDAGTKPELRKILKEQSGTEDLPQLYLKGKCVAKGADFEDINKIEKALEPAIRPWPRSGPYQLGFDGYEGIVQSDQFHRGTWKPRTTGPNAPPNPFLPPKFERKNKTPAQ